MKNQKFISLCVPFCFLVTNCGPKEQKNQNQNDSVVLPDFPDLPPPEQKTEMPQLELQMIPETIEGNHKIFEEPKRVDSVLTPECPILIQQEPQAPKQVDSALALECLVLISQHPHAP